ncbi:MAG: ribosomal protein [Myxococcales bacterium]|nr:ribosomal protein [Myxococcales bacterium]
MSDVVPILEALEKRQLRKQPLPEFKVGDTIKVSVLIKEGEKERAQAFEGVCIQRTGAGNRAAFTVRKVSYGVGVERVFPLHTPRIEKIEVIARGRVRRARLFYLRDLAGKAARIKERSGISPALVVPSTTPDQIPPQQ